MKTPSIRQALIVCTLALAGSAALADDITLFDASPSTRSRAEVRAELQQAQADGSLLGGGELPALRESAPPSAMSLTRQQVRQMLSQEPVRLIAALYGAP